MNVAAFQEMGDFLEQILSVRKQDHGREERCRRGSWPIWFEVQTQQRQARKGEQSRQDGFSKHRKAGGKE